MGQKLGLTRLSEPAPADPTDVLRLECHANVPSSHSFGTPRYANCQSCHAAIHGSNRDRLFFED